MKRHFYQASMFFLFVCLESWSEVYFHSSWWTHISYPCSQWISRNKGYRHASWGLLFIYFYLFSTLVSYYFRSRNFREPKNLRKFCIFRVPTEPGKPGKPGKRPLFWKTQGKPGKLREILKNIVWLRENSGKKFQPHNFFNYVILNYSY